MPLFHLFQQLKSDNKQIKERENQTILNLSKSIGLDLVNKKFYSMLDIALFFYKKELDLEFGVKNVEEKIKSTFEDKSGFDFIISSNEFLESCSKVPKTLNVCSLEEDKSDDENSDTKVFTIEELCRIRSNIEYSLKMLGDETATYAYFNQIYFNDEFVLDQVLSEFEEGLCSLKFEKFYNLLPYLYSLDMLDDKSYSEISIYEHVNHMLRILNKSFKNKTNHNLLSAMCVMQDLKSQVKLDDFKQFEISLAKYQEICEKKLKLSQKTSCDKTVCIKFKPSKKVITTKNFVKYKNRSCDFKKENFKKFLEVTLVEKLSNKYSNTIPLMCTSLCVSKDFSLQKLDDNFRSSVLSNAVKNLKEQFMLSKRINNSFILLKNILNFDCDETRIPIIFRTIAFLHEIQEINICIDNLLTSLASSNRVLKVFDFPFFMCEITKSLSEIIIFAKKLSSEYDNMFVNAGAKLRSKYTNSVCEDLDKSDEQYVKLKKELELQMGEQLYYCRYMFNQPTNKWPNFNVVKLDKSVPFNLKQIQCISDEIDENINFLINLHKFCQLMMVNGLYSLSNFREMCPKSYRRCNVSDILELNSEKGIHSQDCVDAFLLDCLLDTKLLDTELLVEHSKIFTQDSQKRMMHDKMYYYRKDLMQKIKDCWLLERNECIDCFKEMVYHFCVTKQRLQNIFLSCANTNFRDPEEMNKQLKKINDEIFLEQSDVDMLECYQNFRQSIFNYCNKDIQEFFRDNKDLMCNIDIFCDRELVHLIKSDQLESNKYSRCVVSDDEDYITIF